MRDGQTLGKEELRGQFSAELKGVQQALLKSMGDIANGSPEALERLHQLGREADRIGRQLKALGPPMLRQIAASAPVSPQPEILPPLRKRRAANSTSLVPVRTKRDLPPVKLVEKTIKELRTRGVDEKNQKKYVIQWDNEIRGFGVRLTVAGVVSFVLSYRVRDNQRLYTIGRYPEWSPEAARAEAKELQVKIAKGNTEEGDGFDPMKERDRWRGEPTVKDLVTSYLESEDFLGRREQTRREYQRMIDKIIVPKLGALRLKAISKSDVKTKVHDSLKPTPYQANRTLALLSKLFTFAMKAEPPMLTANPAKGIARWDEEERECYLTVDQMRQFMRALDNYNDQNAADALRLLMLTGSREGEVLKATWQQFDLDRKKEWRKPKENTKQKRVVHLNLNDDTLALLTKMKATNPSGGPLFPGTKGRDKDGKRTGGIHRVSLKRAWVQVCKVAGFVDVETRQGKRGEIKIYKPTIRVHDLRHNYASWLASQGESLQVIGELLGHRQLQTTKRYAHLQPGKLSEAANRANFAQIIEFKKGA